MIKIIKSLNKYNLIHSWLWVSDRPINQKQQTSHFLGLHIYCFMLV